MTPAFVPEFSVLIIGDQGAAAGVAFAASLASGEYQIGTATAGQEALDVVAVKTPDLILLDLDLPDTDGVELCRRLRHLTSNPIVVLSAGRADVRKVAALDAGADDYVTKPFSTAQLQARLRVAERQRHVLALVLDDAVLVVGDVVIDAAARAVRVGRADTELTRKEFALLSLLARNPGSVLSHAALLEHAWGKGHGSVETLRVHLAQLRKKLGTGPRRPRIVSERGTGYRLVPGRRVGPGRGAAQTPDAPRS